MLALLAIDDSAESALAVETAAELTWPAGARIEVLTVLPTEAELLGGPWAVGVPYPATDEIRDRLVVAAQALVDLAAAKLERPGLAVEARVAVGRAASVIVDIARETHVDLVILGARGHGALEQAVLGSVSAEVVDQAHCAVLVARKRSARRLLVGTDGSDVANGAIAFVGASGLFESAETRVVHAVDLPVSWWLGFTTGDMSFGDDAYLTLIEDARSHGDAVTSVAAASLRAFGLGSSSTVREGPAASVIVDEARAWNADIVVVGTRGQGLLKRLLLGSTARSVLQHAGASVLITPASPSGLRSHAASTDAVHA